MVVMKTKRWLLITASVLFVLVVLISADYLYHRDRIYAGVFIDGVNVSGKKTAEAQQMLQESFEQKQFFQRQVDLQYGEESWAVSYSQLGIAPDYEETIREAMSSGRRGIHLFRYPQRFSLRRRPVHLQPKLTVNPSTFRSGVAVAAETIRKDPVNAELKLSDDRKKVEIIPDQPGQELDEAATLEQLEAVLKEYPDIPAVKLAEKEVAADTTAAYLESLNIKEPISTFNTYFSGRDANRNHNIRLAAKAMDKTLLLPGSQFSFNEIVGNTTAEKGYRKAPIIVDGGLDEGLGGGICQVSSTLYNTVLLADLKIVERRNHGLVVGYLPPGRDATISYGWIDLKFENNREGAVWLRTFVDGNRLTVTLYGAPVEGQKVSVFTSNLTTIPSEEKIIKTAELPKGVREVIKKGQPGYRVTVWRVTTLNGKEIKREKISQDTYKAVQAEYRVGTAEVPASVEEPVKPDDSSPDTPQEEQPDNTNPPTGPPDDSNTETPQQENGEVTEN